MRARRDRENWVQLPHYINEKWKAQRNQGIYEAPRAETKIEVFQSQSSALSMIRCCLYLPLLPSHIIRNTEKKLIFVAGNFPSQYVHLKLFAYICTDCCGKRWWWPTEPLWELKETTHIRKQTNMLQGLRKCDWGVHVAGAYRERHSRILSSIFSTCPQV